MRSKPSRRNSNWIQTGKEKNLAVTRNGIQFPPPFPFPSLPFPSTQKNKKHLRTKKREQKNGTREMHSPKKSAMLLLHKPRRWHSNKKWRKRNERGRQEGGRWGRRQAQNPRNHSNPKRGTLSLKRQQQQPDSRLRRRQRWREGDITAQNCWVVKPEENSRTWNILFRLDWNWWIQNVELFFSVVWNLMTTEPGICSWHGIDEYVRNPQYNILLAWNCWIFYGTWNILQ